MTHSLADVTLAVVVGWRVLKPGPHTVSYVSHVTRIAAAVTHRPWWSGLYRLVDHVVADRSWIWHLAGSPHLSFKFK